MNFLESIWRFYDRLRTAARRVVLPGLPFSSKWNSKWVLDVGCGSHPNPRAHVAVDAFPEDTERSSPLVIDRPFVWANADRLPFKSKTFSYSIFSHVLEHVANPKETLEELQRVSTAGYIETPNALSEYTIPYTYHLSRVTIINNQLVISPKSSWDETLVDQSLLDVLHDMRKNWLDLHKYDSRSQLTRYYWKDKINFSLRGKIKPDIKIDEIVKAHASNATYNEQRNFFILLLTRIVKTLSRPTRFPDLASILSCPICVANGTSGPLYFSPQKDFAECKTCEKNFPTIRGHLDFRV